MNQFIPIVDEFSNKQTNKPTETSVMQLSQSIIQSRKVVAIELQLQNTNYSLLLFIFTNMTISKHYSTKVVNHLIVYVVPPLRSWAEEQLLHDHLDHLTHHHQEPWILGEQSHLHQRTPHHRREVVCVIAVKTNKQTNNLK